MTKKQLTKAQSLFNKSIELLEVDTSSSLFLSRKNLEFIVHNYFEFYNLEKKQDLEEYPVLSTMINKLSDENYITRDLYNDMEFIRKKGNSAVHFTAKPVNPSIA
ncbi:MAG: DUF4145 domain-containing protein, partial [Romboutsia sp.]|nr:DUF4145 domain-containing protein [Romboutsia sp.]